MFFLKLNYQLPHQLLIQNNFIQLKIKKAPKLLGALLI